MVNSQTPRLFVDGDLGGGVDVAIGAKQANYLTNAMRLKTGDPVRLFNGRHGEWLAHIATVGRKACTLRCGEQTRAQSAPRALAYLFAPLKRARLDYLVQKASEMGVTQLRPVLTRHTVARRINPARMRANAIEAAEQCNLLAIPEIADLRPLDAALDAWDARTVLVYCDEAAPPRSPLAVLRRLDRQIGGVLVGPEGGFSEQEREALRARSCITAISLGERVLRADTAAVAALALVQAVAEDWPQWPQEDIQR